MFTTFDVRYKSKIGVLVEQFNNHPRLSCFRILSLSQHYWTICECIKCFVHRGLKKEFVLSWCWQIE